MKRIKGFIKEMWRLTSLPEMRILPGQIAFFLLLSIIPIIAILGALSTSLSFSLDGIINYIEITFPGSVSEFLVPMLVNGGMNFNFAFFFISSFVLASNGPYSMINASNTLYGIRDNAYLKRRIKALFLTVILMMLILFVLLIPTFGTDILNFLSRIPLLEGFNDKLVAIFNVLKWPLSLLYIYFNVKLLYTISPDTNIKSQDVTNGAWFTTVGWLLISTLYSYYVTNFTSYGLFYGALSNILILLLWFYLLAYVFVLGMAMNVFGINNESIK